MGGVEAGHHVSGEAGRHVPGLGLEERGEGEQV